MQVNPVLSDWLEDVLRDQVIVSEEKPELELENTWALTIPTDRGITVGDMTEWFDKITERRKRQIPIRMTIYSWYDETAGQFHFSLTSLPKEKLPFGCDIEHVNSIGEIFSLCLEESNPGFVPNDELEEISIAEAFRRSEKDKGYVLKVWSLVINETTYS